MNDKLPKGYMGKILTVDLSEKKFRQEPLYLTFTNRFFGGRGFGIRLVFEHFVSLEKTGKYKNAFKEADPLSEDNILVFSTSPTTGTGMPTSGRLHVNFKSPQTNGIGSANSGGRWAVAFKKTGHDVLQIKGKSESPIYLKITSEKVEFLRAEELAALNVEEITDALQQNAPKGSRVITIGQAGRNLSRFAAIMNDRGRAMGRGGGGAVFGSKNLLAILVYLDSARKITVDNPDNLRLSNEGGARFKAKLKLDVGKMTRKEEDYGVLSTMGTLGILGMVNAFDELIHNNMQNTRHRPADIEKISGEALRNHANIARTGANYVEMKKGACFNCPITCTRRTKIRDANGKILDQGEGPEFETVALLGANLSIYDLSVITEANYWANRYGLDTISLGGTIAAFFELYDLIREKTDKKTATEKTFLSDVQEFIDRHGAPGFGQIEILVPLVHMIGKGEGIGKALAEGSFRFCKRYGHEELSMSVKKLELPAYDPRATFLQGLNYEMNNRGGCHLQNGYTAIRAFCAGYAEWPGDRIEGSAIVAKNAAFGNTVMDIIGSCTFASISLGLDEFAVLINTVTGLNLNAELLQLIAWRTLTLERMFNVLAGFTCNDDRLPERFFEEIIEVEGKPKRCDRKAFAQMHQEYYQAMGWDPKGIPKEETLKELDLLDRHGVSFCRNILR